VKSWRPKPQSVFIAATHAGTLTHTHSLLRPFHKRTFIFSFSQRRTLAWLPFYHTHTHCIFGAPLSLARKTLGLTDRASLWPAVVFLLSHTPGTLHTYIGRQRTHIFPAATIIGYQLRRVRGRLLYIYFAWRGAHSSKRVPAHFLLSNFKDDAHSGLK
jgi:hypothetical protein